METIGYPKTIEIVPHEQLKLFEGRFFNIYLDEQGRTFSGSLAFGSRYDAKSVRSVTRPNSRVRIVSIKPGAFQRVTEWPE